MRKVLSFVLVLALVLGSFSMAFAATPTDVAGTDYSEAVTVLSGLGVVAGYADGTYKPAQAVTRAEMAKLIVVALGLEDYAIGTSKFADMAGATWAQGYVNYAAGLGVILGYPDGTFKPSQTVSYDEAAAMIVRALGYTDASLLPATWPANYVVKAKAIGVLKDVTSKAGGADRGDVAIMLYNAITKSIGSIDKDGIWQATSGDTMIARLGTTGPTTKAITATMVGDADYTLVDLSEYVYANLSVYKSTDTHNPIVAIAGVDSDSAVGEFTSGTSVTANTITLANDDVVTLAGIAGTNIYLNGGEKAYSADYAKLLTGYDVTAYGELNSTEDILTVSGIVAWAPTAIWHAVKADVTDISNALIDGSGQVFDVELPTVDSKGKVLDLAKITVVGAATKLADIKADDVVYVYAAADSATPSKVKFEVVRNAKDVTVTKINATTIYDGATAYKFFAKNAGVDGDTIASVTGIEVTDKYTVYLGNDGKIVFRDLISATPDNFGVVVTMGKEINDTYGGGSTFKIKLLTSDNDFVVFDIDDTTTATTAAVGATYTTGSGVTYSLNSDGQITSLAGMRTKLVGTYSARSNALAGKFVASNVVVFNATATVTASATVFPYLTPVALDTTGWETTSLIDGDTFANLSTTTGQAYYAVDADSDEIVAIVYHAKTGGTTSSNYFAVNAAGFVQNAAEEVVLEITGFKGAVANTSLTTLLAKPSTVPSVPVVYTVTYSGVVVSAMAAVPYTVSDVTVVDASDVFVSVTASSITTIYAVDTDVLVYVGVDDADGVLDSYKIGSMNDVTAGDKAWLYNDATDGVQILVLQERADI